MAEFIRGCPALPLNWSPENDKSESSGRWTLKPVRQQYIRADLSKLPSICTPFSTTQQQSEATSRSVVLVERTSITWKSAPSLGQSTVGFLLRLRGLSWSLAVLALDPHSVHGQLFSSVHLQPSVHKILHFLKPCCSEELMELVWSKQKIFTQYNTTLILENLRE